MARVSRLYGFFPPLLSYLFYTSFLRPLKPRPHPRFSSAPWSYLESVPSSSKPPAPRRLLSTYDLSDTICIHACLPCVFLCRDHTPRSSSSRLCLGVGGSHSPVFLYGNTLPQCQVSAFSPFIILVLTASAFEASLALSHLTLPSGDFFLAPDLSSTAPLNIIRSQLAFIHYWLAETTRKRALCLICLTVRSVLRRS